MPTTTQGLLELAEWLTAPMHARRHGGHGRAALRDALHGRVTDHHRFMIKLHLTQIDTLETAVAAIEGRIGDAIGPFRAALNLLTTMPGLSETTARVLIAEIGTDMTRFPAVGSSSRGPASARGWMRARANDAPRAPDRAHGGSNPP